MQMGNPSFGSKWVGVMLALGLASPVLAGEVRTVSLEAGSTTTRAEIQLEGKGEYKTISLAGPDRLVVDLPASRAARNLKLPSGAGIIKSVRTGQPTPDTLRIVFDLAKPVGLLKPRMEPSATGARLILEWPGGNPVAEVKPGPAPATTSVEPTPSAASAAQATAALTTSVVRQAATQAPAPQANVPTQASVVATQPAGSATSASATGSKPSPQEILNGRASALVPSTSGETRPQPQPEVAAAAVVQPQAPAPTQPEPRIAMRAGMRPLVIAIDPGHGGQDPGAIGPSGKYEKHIVLAISKELARQINATPGMRAYLVRETDVYVERPQRARKARAAKADLFVSIHADAAENRSAWGSSVYVMSLRGASSQHARWLADKENASDLVGGVRLTQDTLSNVLLDLAQSGHMKASQNAAGYVLDGLKQLGKTHKPQIEFANFEVLRNSDMPSMLVETGFISNPDEEKRLTDPGHQRKVAAAVLTGIQSYFTREPPPGTLFAARAQAVMGNEAGGGSP